MRFDTYRVTIAMRSRISGDPSAGPLPTEMCEEARVDWYEMPMV